MKKIILLLALSFINNKTIIETGTIIATVYTPNKIYLFSDGRSTEFGTDKIISNNRNKIYKISEKCALLCAGIRISELKDQIINISKKNKAIYVTDIAKYTSEYLIEYWRNLLLFNKNNPQYTNNIRIFIVVCGYDKEHHQREYLLDNISTKPFKIQEHKKSNSPIGDVLFMGGDKKYSSVFFNKLSTTSMNDNSIKKAFDDTKDIISSEDIGIVGQTFEAIITDNHLTELK